MVRQGFVPPHLAAMLCSRVSLVLLLRAGADFEAADGCGLTSASLALPLSSPRCILLSLHSPIGDHRHRRPFDEP